MSGKITKDISSHLFKFVKTIDVTFNPFDKRTKSVLELYQQVMAERIQKANPKLVITPNVTSSPNPPTARFTFVDGSELLFDSRLYLCKEMMNDIYLHASNISVKYDMDEKSIDDE